MELLIIMASVEGSTPSTRPGLNLAFAAEMKVAGGYGTVCVYAYVVFNTTPLLSNVSLLCHNHNVSCFEFYYHQTPYLENLFRPLRRRLRECY